MLPLLFAVVLGSSGCSQRQLGVNHAGEKLERDRSAGAAVGYYFLSRLLDTIDILTINVGVGPALHAEAHVTQYGRLGIGGAYLASVGTSAAPREYGFFGRGIGELSLFPWQAQVVHWDEFLSSGENFDLTHVGMRRPTEQIFRRKVDFWSVGASGGLGVVGGQLEVHPIQIADWLLGWFTLDFLNDDI